MTKDSWLYPHHYLGDSELDNQQIFPKSLEFMGYIHKDGDKVAYFRDRNGETVKVSSSRRFIEGKLYVSLAQVNPVLIDPIMFER